MLSCEMLLGITGDLTWADRCEDVAFNTFPPALTADLKALHYLVSPNVCQLDSKNKAPGIQNGGEMLSYNPHSYRCCQHNVAHGWPYFAEHLWMATPDNGLAAVFYAASQVTAKVGDGRQVTWKQETRYPFEDAIRMTLSASEPVEFPLYLRVPGWCNAPTLRVNGRKVPVYPEPRTFIVIDRKWKDGDTVDLTLPMELKLRYWIRNGNTVSVDRGPLTYSLKIGEKYVRYGGTDKWPAQEVYPTTAWNYGLVDRSRQAAPGAAQRSREELAQRQSALRGPGRSDRDQGESQKDPELAGGSSRPDRRGTAQPRQVRPACRNRDADPDGRRPAANLRLPLDRRRPERPRVAGVAAEQGHAT